MIHDRLVCGINEDSIQKHLLMEGDKLCLLLNPMKLQRRIRLNCCQRRLYHSQYTESNLQQLMCTTRSVTDVQDQDTSQVPVILRRNAATIAIRLATLSELVQQILRVHLSGMCNLYLRRVPLQSRSTLCYFDSITYNSNYSLC